MEALIDFILDIGPFAVFAVIFAESGLLIGFFLPGDSLLFAAGVFTALGRLELPLPLLLLGCFIAAVLGDNVGYTFGRRVGTRLFQREDSLLFHKKNVIKAQQFYEKHGGKAIVLARFVPIVRTFAPIVAGIGEMNYRRFVMFNLLGGLFWAVGVTLAGYLLGDLIPAEDVDKYLLPIIIVIVLVSVAPPAYHVLREPENREKIFNMARRILGRPAIERTPEPNTD